MKNTAKAVVFAVLLAVLFCGCKKQQTPDATNSNGDKVQAVIPNVTEPELPNKDKNTLSLTLSEDFVDYSDNIAAENYDFLYTNGNIAIGMICNTKPEHFTLEDYAMREAEYFQTEMTEKDGFWTIAFEDFDSNDPQMMINVYYENDNSFWTVQGFCLSENYEQYQTQIWQYITSGVFAGE